MQSSIQAGIDGLLYYYHTGGFVMPPLVLSAFLLWYALGFRMAAVKRGSSRSVRNLIERYAAGKWQRPAGIVQDAVVRGTAIKAQGLPNLRRHLDDAFGDYRKRLTQFSLLARIIVASSPLLGLLGTVSGMIETFDSLTDSALFAQSGGIAGGISQALITTQLGLAIAIPGLLICRMVDKRQQRIEMDLLQIKDILCSQPEAGLRSDLDSEPSAEPNI